METHEGVAKVGEWKKIEVVGCIVVWRGRRFYQFKILKGDRLFKILGHEVREFYEDSNMEEGAL